MEKIDTDCTETQKYFQDTQVVCLSSHSLLTQSLISQAIHYTIDAPVNPGGLPYKPDRSAGRKFLKQPLKGTRISISGRGPN